MRSALERTRAWWVYQALDAERMKEAAQLLLGEHDFSAFRAAGCHAKSAHREITKIDIVRTGDWITLQISANAFLQHMVRNIMGALVAVGAGERPVKWMTEVLESLDRTKGGIAAPPHGLTLVSVDYPEAAGIPQLWLSRNYMDIMAP